MNPRAQPGEFRGLFVDIHLEPGLLQEPGGGGSTQTGPDNGDSLSLSHGYGPLLTWGCSVGAAEGLATGCEGAGGASGGFLPGLRPSTVALNSI